MSTLITVTHPLSRFAEFVYPTVYCANFPKTICSWWLDLVRRDRQSIRYKFPVHWDKWNWKVNDRRSWFPVNRCQVSMHSKHRQNPVVSLSDDTWPEFRRKNFSSIAWLVEKWVTSDFEFCVLKVTLAFLHRVWSIRLWKPVDPVTCSDAWLSIWKVYLSIMTWLYGTVINASFR